MDDDLVAKEKALPAVLQWLSATFEVARGNALPKREVYRDYVNFCVTHSIEPTNAPAFGKILRMVFPDITSRRLGRRGHTSHHYNHFRRKGETSVGTQAPTIGGRPYNHEDRAPPHNAPQYRDFERPPYPTNQQPHYDDPYSLPAPPMGPTERQPFPIAQHHSSHREFNSLPPQERTGRYLQGTGPPPQPAAFFMRNGDDSHTTINNGNNTLHNMVVSSSSRGHVKMEHTSSLPMGQPSFEDEDYIMQHKRYASHPSPFAYPPSQSMRTLFQSPSPLVPPSHINHHTISPHPPVSNHPPPPPPQLPNYPQPSSTPSPQLYDFPPTPVEKSSLIALINSPDFTLQGAESFNCSIADLDPRIRGCTVPVVVCPSTYSMSRRISKGSFSHLSPPDLFPVDIGKVPMFALDTQQLPYNDLKQEARHFTTMYRNHMQTVFIALAPPFDFDAVCAAMYMFWPQAKQFHRLFSSQCVIDQILEIDSMLYSSMLGLLVPDLFAETPPEVSERIINFARIFPGWLRTAMSFVVPFTMYEFKLKVAENFSKALRTRVVINQLSIKLRHALGKEKEREKIDPEKPTMLEDWGALDFEYIDGQTWIFGEFKKIPATIKDNMPVLLSQRVQVEVWSKWLMEVTENVMRGYYAPYTLTVSEFLLKWTMYTSLISKYLVEIHSSNLELFMLLFCWIEALLALYLEEHEQLQLKKAKSRTSSSFSLRRDSLPGTASFSSLTPTPLGQTLIPNIMVPDDDFSDF